LTTPIKHLTKQPAFHILHFTVWLFSLPAVLAINLVRVWALRRLVRDEMPCRVCGAALMLLGLWQCGSCGYSFYGFYFARCEECGAIPPYLDCDDCAASTPNPLIFR